MKTMNKRGIFSLIFIFSVLSITAQEKYQLVTSSSSLTIEGTSNVHDWTMDAQEITCYLLIDKKNNTVQNIEQIGFSCPIEKIISDNIIMDKKPIMH